MKYVTFLPLIGLFITSGVALAEETGGVKMRQEILEKRSSPDQTDKGIPPPTRTESRERRRIPFLDENGDGINDVLFRDDDGDGIPNRRDDDWLALQEGAGARNVSFRRSDRRPPVNRPEDKAVPFGAWDIDAFRRGLTSVFAGSTRAGSSAGACPKSAFPRRGKG